MEKEKPVINTTFITRNKAIEGKLMLLGHAFTQAVAEGESKLAGEVIKEALILKEFEK